MQPSDSLQETSSCREISLAFKGLMENKMEATIVYRGYTGTMENKWETSI